jgi:hypothetical protein
MTVKRIGLVWYWRVIGIRQIWSGWAFTKRAARRAETRLRFRKGIAEL